MMSKVPIELGKVEEKQRDMQSLRVAMAAELDAINLYEQLAAQTIDVVLKRVLFDVAREEKTHLGEFQEMLLAMDAEQVKELEKAKGEVKELREE